MEEFNGLVEALRSHGVVVHTFAGEEGCADAVWPNNWIVTMSTGGDASKVVSILFPMKNEARQLERNNKAVRAFLRERYGEADDLTANEQQGRILEGTGSIVMDRDARIAYVSVSERSNEAVAREWAQRYNMQLVLFRSEHRGKPVYHTNVVMAVAHKVAVVAADVVVEGRDELLQSLRGAGKFVVEISSDQVGEFCGNCLEVVGSGGRRFLAMSTRAFNGFTEDQKQAMAEHGLGIIHADISTLENIGGGSVRCMMAELF
eukprot:TRINITY_DN3488_c0_g1_i2.p1 TRINITY_DN3488_c0_g1~~TRINITY_DN3488_c0_g1_i2.p1  ORF type:complete len:261 (-),score=114.61 TRINITY_DN3488_c0_g1_i2:205-987(-)